MRGYLRYVARSAFVAGFAVTGACIYQLMKQQGALLLRLEELEDSTADVHVDGGEQASTDQHGDRPQGLGVTLPIPAFSLPTLSGEQISFEDFRGNRLLLVHWDPLCGFCAEIAPRLASLQPKLAQRRTRLLLISNGDAETNRRLVESAGLNCRVLLQPAGRPIDAFQRLGTPVAYLVDQKGRVAKPLAVGADEVLNLAQTVASARRRLESEKPLSTSKIEREGLTAGTIAPPFSIPMADAVGVLRLGDYQGRRILLVFSDPACGPCNAIAPRLQHAYSNRAAPALEVLMISRGGQAENRQKMAENHLTFPVGIQPGWQVSKQYGIFSTPVAFLLDEDHRIATGVARGSDEVLDLAQRACNGGMSARREPAVHAAHPG